MAIAKVKADKYVTIGTDLLGNMGHNLTGLWAAKQAADQTARAAREAFEAAFTAALVEAGTPVPANSKPVFGMFGLSIGVDAKGNMLFRPIGKKAGTSTTDVANPIAALFAAKGNNGTGKAAKATAHKAK